MMRDNLLLYLDELLSSPDDIEPVRDLFLNIGLAQIKNERKSALNSNWELLELAEVADIAPGDSIPSEEKALKYEGLEAGRPYIATKDVLGRRGQIDYENGVRIPFEMTKFKVASPGALLVCAEGGSAGRKIGLVEQEVCYGNKLFAITLDESKVLPQFLLQVLQSPQFYHEFKSRITGIIGGVSLAGFKSIKVPVPPIREQLWLADYLEQSLTACDALGNSLRLERDRRHDAERACVDGLIASEESESKQQAVATLLGNFEHLFCDVEGVRTLRGVILDLSIRGAFSSDAAGDADDAGASDIDTRTGELLKLQDENGNGGSEPFSLPPQWEWRALGSLTNPSRPISYGVIKLGPEDTDGTPVLRCSDVRFRQLDLTAVRKVSPAIESDYARTRLMGGEVLVNIRGTLGGCAIVPRELAGFNIAREVAMLDANPRIDPRYLLNVVSSPYFQRAVSNNLRGIAYKGINLGTLARLPVPVPPLAVQRRVVKAAEEMLSFCDELELRIVEHDRSRTTVLSALSASISDQVSSGILGRPSVQRDESFLSPWMQSAGRGQNESPEASQAEIIDRAKDIPREGERSSSSRVDEALLVSAIVLSFFAQGGEPVGNFRMQKAVYFAWRKLGEAGASHKFLRGAAGPYNPSLRYEGGLAYAKSCSYVREAKGRFGFGYIPGQEAREVQDLLNDRQDLLTVASWVRARFKTVDNDHWELLSTVDYAVQLFEQSGHIATPQQVLSFIKSDKNWAAKVPRLRLTSQKVASAMSEIRALFQGD